jgi:acetyltransferase-like isoleucine patch superfamily enzyme
MTRVGRIIADLIGGAVLWIPGGIGSRLRIAYYRARGADIAPGVRIDVGACLDDPGRIHIGADSWIDRFAILIAGEPRPGRETRLVGADNPGLVGRIFIGERCHVGPYVVLSGLGGLRLGDDVTLSNGASAYSLSHHYRSWSRPADRSTVFGSRGPANLQSMLQGPVILEDNVGVAAGALLLPGTCIGPDSFVRPHSVVSGDWPENTLLGGDPAERQGPRFDERNIET